METHIGVGVGKYIEKEFEKLEAERIKEEAIQMKKMEWVDPK